MLSSQMLLSPLRHQSTAPHAIAVETQHQLPPPETLINLAAENGVATAAAVTTVAVQPHQPTAPLVATVETQQQLPPPQTMTNLAADNGVATAAALSTVAVQPSADCTTRGHRRDTAAFPRDHSTATVLMDTAAATPLCATNMHR